MEINAKPGMNQPPATPLKPDPDAVDRGKLEPNRLPGGSPTPSPLPMVEEKLIEERRKLPPGNAEQHQNKEKPKVMNPDFKLKPEVPSGLSEGGLGNPGSAGNGGQHGNNGNPNDGPNDNKPEGNGKGNPNEGNQNPNPAPVVPPNPLPAIPPPSPRPDPGNNKSKVTPIEPSKPEGGANGKPNEGGNPTSPPTTEEKKPAPISEGKKPEPSERSIDHGNKPDGNNAPKPEQKSAGNSNQNRNMHNEPNPNNKLPTSHIVDPTSELRDAASAHANQSPKSEPPVLNTPAGLPDTTAPVEPTKGSSPVGAIVGAFIGIAVVGFIGFVFLRRRASRRSRKSSHLPSAFWNNVNRPRPNNPPATTSPPATTTFVPIQPTSFNALPPSSQIVNLIPHQSSPSQGYANGMVSTPAQQYPYAPRNPYLDRPNDGLGYRDELVSSLNRYQDADANLNQPLPSLPQDTLKDWAPADPFAPRFVRSAVAPAEGKGDMAAAIANLPPLMTHQEHAGYRDTIVGSECGVIEEDGDLNDSTNEIVYSAMRVRATPQFDDSIARNQRLN
jgi:hypothetical protein